MTKHFKTKEQMLGYKLPKDLKKQYKKLYQGLEAVTPYNVTSYTEPYYIVFYKLNS